MREVISLSFGTLEIETERIGEDLLVTAAGGEKPHIGCCVLGVPRPSLTGDGTVSATLSVLNVTGHMDDALCRILAEKAVRTFGCVCVCTGGFHVDGITKEEIEELLASVRAFRFRGETEEKKEEGNES